MNCLYITLFFNIVAGIVQIFIKSSNQLLYPRVIEVCCLPFGSGGMRMAPLQLLLLGFRSVVKTPWFISSHSGVQKLTCFLCVAREKLQRENHPFRFVIAC